MRNGTATQTLHANRTASHAANATDNTDSADSVAFALPSFTWNGVSYEIHPLPNTALLAIGDAVGHASDILDLVMARLTARLEQSEGGNLTPADVVSLLPVLPEAAKLLIPLQTKIVAASLRLDEETVADQMSLGKKMEATQLILQNEDLPALFSTFSSLIEMFRGDDARKHLSPE